MLGTAVAVSAAPRRTDIERPLGAPSFASFAKGGLFLAAASPSGANPAREAVTAIINATRMTLAESFNISYASRFTIAFEYNACNNSDERTDANATHRTAPQHGSQAAII